MSHENYALSDVGQKPYVIFAVVPGIDVEQFMRSRGVPFKTVRGSYRMRDSGEIVQETSYIVSAEDWDKWLEGTAVITGQESILVLGPKASRDAHRPAILHYLDGEKLPVFLGYFVDCEEHVAKAQPGWTEDDGVFYACFHDVEDAQE
jgi:hypothetical protein